MRSSPLLADLQPRAETLWERLERPLGASPGGDEERLRETLAPWAKAYARGYFAKLERRLAWDATSPELAALAFSTAAEAHDTPWSRELERYVAVAADTAVVEDWQARSGDVPFMELWLPWVKVAEEGVGEDGAGVELGPALDDLKSHLLANIARLSELAAYELFERRRQRMKPEPYRGFIADCLEDPLRLYGTFPVLARQTAEMVRQWREQTAELARRLAADRPEMAEVFFGGRAMGGLRAVRPGLSDRHRGGRQVLALAFESGAELIYKPRSVALEQALGRFFDRCAALDPDLRLRMPRVLARRDPSGREYGWEELVAPQPLADREAAAGYYRRAGGLAAMAYVLRAQDLHAENLVATRDGPVVVDAEMFLQPLQAMKSTDAQAGPKPGSCLESGLLTQGERGLGNEVRELGGLRAQPPVRSTRSARGWRHVNTDDMRLEAAELWIEPRENAVRIDGELAPPEAFRAELAGGFEQAYRFWLRHRREMLAEDGPLEVFHGTRVRVLFRRSQDYWTVLELSAQPRHQRSGLSASLLREALLQVFADHDERPLLWPLVADERCALEGRDVPYFALGADETVLRSRSGEPVEGYFARSGLEAVRQRITELGEEDLERQLKLLHGVLEPKEPLPFLGPASSPVLGASRGEFTHRCRELALGIGRYLLSRPDSGDPRPTLDHGRLGCALFLAALGRTFDDDRFTRNATRLARSTPARSELGLGGFSGLGSSIYGLTWIARLTGDAGLVGLALEAAREIDEAALARDHAFDVLGGSAGALLGLLALAEATAEKDVLERARRCGDHLADHQELLSSAGAAWRNGAGVALAGWAHGASGIARALAALAEATGETRYRVAAAAALGYERGLYDAEQRNWPVLTGGDTRDAPRRGWMTAWCHGAPGVALGRLLLPEPFADAALAAELETALDTTAGVCPGGLDHLCCGAFGRSSVLLTAAQRLTRQERLRQARTMAMRALDRAFGQGRFRLAEDPEPDPGFLKGLAGVGYQLLRLAGAPGLPDALALELPEECRQRMEKP